MASLLPRSAFVILACAAFAIVPARAETLIISGPSTAAAGIRSDNETAAGSASQLIVGQFSNSDRRGRALFAFDLSGIPEGSLIESVSLVLTLETQDAGSTVGLVPLELFQLTGGSFAEDTVSWKRRAAGTDWTTPGGDSSPALLSSAMVDPRGTIPSPIKFESTPAFVNAVASNLGGTASFLLKLNDTDESNATTRRTFFIASDDTGTVNNRPVFTVQYSVPEPASAMLLLAGAAFAHTLRWRRR